MRKVLLLATAGLIGLALAGTAVWAWYLQRPAASPSALAALPPVPPPPASRAVPVQVLGRAPAGLLADRDGPAATSTRIIRTEAELEKRAPKATWGQLARQFGVASLDFREHMVLEVLHGPFPHGGHRVEVQRVVQEGGRWTVYWKLHAPGPDQPVAGILSHPGEWALVPRFAGEARFVRVGE